MINIMQKWAEEYMKINEEVMIQISGGGSGTGVAALINGTTDISVLSRELKNREIEDAERLGVKTRIVPVALDAIAVIVNPKNSIDSLTLEELSDVFSGKIKTWKKLNFIDKRIILYGRENSSGTYELFKNIIFSGDKSGEYIDYSPSIQSLQGTASIAEAVSRDISGIGYGGIGFFLKRSDVKILSIANDANGRAISPVYGEKINYEVVWNNVYPLTRKLYCMIKEDAKPETLEFINYILSKEGQKCLFEMEFIPLLDIDKD